MVAIHEKSLEARYEKLCVVVNDVNVTKDAEKRGRCTPLVINYAMEGVRPSETELNTCRGAGKWE